MVAKLKRGPSVCEEREDPVTEGRQEAHVAQDVGDPGGVDVIKEPRDVEQEESTSMARVPHGLDTVNQGGDSIHGIVVGSGPELCHREEVVCRKVDIDPFGNNLFHQLAGALQQADGAVGLGLAVIGAVRFIEDDYCRILPWMNAKKKR